MRLQNKALCVYVCASPRNSVSLEHAATRWPLSEALWLGLGGGTTTAARKTGVKAVSLFPDQEIFYTFMKCLLCAHQALEIHLRIRK